MERMLTVTYSGVVAARVDRRGNLRLVCREPFLFRRLLRERAFHPAGEWESVSVTPVDAVVTLWAPSLP